MCGRFFLISQSREVSASFGLEEAPYIEPRYNIAPTQSIAVVRLASENDDVRILTYMRWGLVPPWTKDLSKLPTLINARSESANEKPVFRGAFKKRHCVIPANGFFEWSRRGSTKEPYVFQLSRQRLFAFAGLWESWENLDGAVLESCTILTTEANDVVRVLHDRMPVILDHDGVDLWLKPASKDQGVRRKLFRSANSNDMECYQVSTRVSNPKYDDHHCIEPIISF